MNEAHLLAECDCEYQAETCESEAGTAPQESFSVASEGLLPGASSRQETLVQEFVQDPSKFWPLKG